MRDHYHTMTHDLGHARRSLFEHGGILIQQNGTFIVGAPIGPDAQWFGRSMCYLDSLAPSWDETHPDNAGKQLQGMLAL